MAKRVNDDAPMTWKDWAVFAVVAAVVVWILYLLGPALDKSFAFEDARIEAHRASLVSK